MYLFKSIGGGPTYISGAAQDIQKNDRLSSGHLRPFYNICPCFYVIILQY